MKTQRASGMRNKRMMGLVATASLGALLGALLSGGCKKPPPPPPPAPPPPPPPVSIRDVVSEQLPNIDPRVSWRDDISVIDRDFLVAALKLADAFAKGNADEAKKFLDPQAAAVVTELVNSGQWAEASKSVEAVRVVFAAPPGEMNDMERERAIEQLKGQIDKDVARIFELAQQAGQSFESASRVRDAARKRLESQVADLRAGNAPGVVGLQDPLNTIIFTNQQDAERNAEALQEGGPKGERPAFVMLMAVQTPRGADLLGWTALRRDTGYIFRAASTLPFAYSRAQDWDNIGMFGFSLNLGKVRPPEQVAEQATPQRGQGAGGGPAGPGLSPDGTPKAPEPAAPPTGPRGPRGTPGGQ